MVVEEVTSVNQKCRARALRPPVTIKNFFKPATLHTNDAKEDACSTEVNSCVSVDTPVEAAEKPQTSEDSTNTKALKSVPDLSKISRKRPLSDMPRVPVSKRTKQTNLAAMFANVTKRKKETGVNTQVCPICKEEFKGISNMDLNVHIDSCLIE